VDQEVAFAEFRHRRDRHGDLRWQQPTVSSVIAILRNPAYAGAFVDCSGSRNVPADIENHCRSQACHAGAVGYFSTNQRATAEPLRWRVSLLPKASANQTPS
jgi:hypothetical protein